jgi:nitroimidazol reductase NimA-like FMN-containing flavoprotein (pyridoxamine 5'-phosphate oxidase superfamily)
MAVKEDRIRETIRKLMSDEKVAVLATDADSQPYATLVGFVADEELKHVYFVTTRATRKYAALTDNPRVAMLVDNRSNRFQDFREACAVTALGRAVEVDKEAHGKVLGDYLERLPHLEEFVNSPTSALVCISVRAYYLVTRFQHVMELHIER